MHKVIKFHADWCGPCKNYGPIFDKVTNRLTGNWKVEKYNIESPEGSEIAVAYGVKSIPTTVIEISGKEPRKLVGALSSNTLAKELTVKKGLVE